MDGVVVGGDVIAGPMPEETLALLRALAVPTYFVRGNAESEVLAHLVGADAGSSGAAVVARWVAARLSPESARFVAGWPATVRLTLGGLGGVLFCHATPGSDTEVFTRLTAEARLQRLFGGVDAAVVVCGHTHMAFDRSVAGVRIVNAGSVGMPYGQPGAHWLLLDGSPPHQVGVWAQEDTSITSSCTQADIWLKFRGWFEESDFFLLVWRPNVSSCVFGQLLHC